MRKNVVIALAIVTMLILMAPAVVQQAKADYLPPTSCQTAAEFGWTKIGWNWFCAIDLQMNCCDPMGDPWY